MIDDELDIGGLSKVDNTMVPIFHMGFDCDFDNFLFVNRSQRLAASCQGQKQCNRKVSQPQGAPNECS